LASVIAGGLKMVDRRQNDNRHNRQRIIPHGATMDPEAFQLREEPVIDAGPAVLMLRDRSRRTGAWCSGRCVVAARKPAWDWNM